MCRPPKDVDAGVDGVSSALLSSAGAPTVQQVLDVVLTWAALNKHFQLAEFLLAQGADVNTEWVTHESASILHAGALSRQSAE